MIRIQGLWWPDDVGEQWRHALRHVRSLEWSLARCPRRRTTVQAGGNIGLWPRRLAQAFSRVITFEPDAVSRACLERNVPANVEVYPDALGAVPGWCGLAHRSLGSHRIVTGESIRMTTIDALQLRDLDFLQLDIEGYECHALAGAQETLQRCHPLVQVELRGFTQKYGASEAQLRFILSAYGYVEVSRQAGCDVVFEVPA